MVKENPGENDTKTDNIHVSGWRSGCIPFSGWFSCKYCEPGRSEETKRVVPRQRSVHGGRQWCCNQCVVIQGRAFRKLYPYYEPYSVQERNSGGRLQGWKCPKRDIWTHVRQNTWAAAAGLPWRYKFHTNKRKHRSRTWYFQSDRSGGTEFHIW